MGFFSKILGGVIRVGRGLLGLPPAAVAVTAAAAVPVARTLIGRGTAALATRGRQVAALAARPSVAAGLGLGAGLVAGSAIQRAQAAQAGLPGAPTGLATPLAVLGRGNGQIVKQTIVQSIDIMTGTVVREVVTQGDVFLFSKDVSKLRGTAKKLLSAAGKIPRRTTTTSKAKQVTDAVQDAVLRSVVQGVACPK